MSKLILIRGIPGSGKSTLAKHLASSDDEYDTAIVYEADMYFTVLNGLTRQYEYRFDPKLLPKTHAACLKEVESGIKYRGNKDIIVANTFVCIWEMQAYLDLAEKYNVKIEIYQMSHEPVLNGTQKSVHNILEESVLKKHKQWEELPNTLTQYVRNVPKFDYKKVYMGRVVKTD